MTYTQAECLHRIATAARERADQIGMSRPWSLTLQREHQIAMDTAVDLYNIASRAYQRHTATWERAA